MKIFSFELIEFVPAAYYFKENSTVKGGSIRSEIPKGYLIQVVHEGDCMRYLSYKHQDRVALTSKVKTAIVFLKKSVAEMQMEKIKDLCNEYGQFSVIPFSPDIEKNGNGIAAQPLIVLDFAN